MSDLQKIEYSRKLDLNFAVDGEEKAKGYVCENPVTVNEIQVDQNKQGQQGSSSLHVDFGEENPTSCHSESQFVSTEFDQYDARTNNSCEQGEMDELPHSNFCKSSFEFKAQTVHHERETEDSAHSQESPLTADRNKLEETECDPNVDRPNTSPQDEKENDRLVDNSMYEFTNSPDKEVLGKTIGHQTGNLSTYPSSILGEGESQPKNERYHYVANSPSGSWKLDMPHFIPHSPGSTHRRSTSPAMVNQTLVSPEGSPCIHMSLNGHKPPSSSENVPDQLLCPTQPRETHSSSPERSNLAKRISPPHHLSPSATRTSASPKRSRPGSRHKNGSSLQRMPQSTDSSYSPRKNNKPEKSVIRSHIPRRDSSSAYGRDYHDRSRSRSPYMRDHYGSPRRRYSPRRRSSPGYHSLRHSPRRRPWFPPPNRRNGVGKPGNNLFVAGFSFLTTERDLERKFSRFGHVRDVRIVRDKRSGDSRGFGFLSLESDEDADAAIRALDETEWNGRVILVEKSKSTR